MSKLLLWDIDGTLLHASGAGVRALLGAMKSCFDVDATAHGINMAGRTDLGIIAELFGKFLTKPLPRDLDRYLDEYHRILLREIKNGDTRLYPGVESALDEARGRGDIVQALLTGNTREAARVKLDHFSLGHFFQFGAFGDENADRNALAELALVRAGEVTGTAFEPERTFVIGDTVRDVACGAAIGAHTVAVATGAHSADQLSACRPTAVLPDLSDAAALFAVIDGV